MDDEPGGSPTLTLVGKVVLAMAKGLAAASSGSVALASETVHTLVDCGHRLLLQRGEASAGAPSQGRFPFGRASEVQFWSHIVAALLFGLGAGICLWQGIDQIRAPQPVMATRWTYLLFGLAIAFELVAWLDVRRGFARDPGVPLRRALRQSPRPGLGSLLIQEAAALAGLAVALAGILAADRLGMLRADGLASLAIAGILMIAGVELAIASRGAIIAEGADEDLVHDLLGLAGQADFVEAVNEVRTIQFGPGDVLVNLSVDAHDPLTAAEVETGVSRLETAIRAGHPEVTRVFIAIQRAGDGAAMPA